MLSTAKLRYLRIAPRKVRLVANLIRGEKLEGAQVILNFTRKRAALPILKLLNQALANALEKDLKLDKKNIYISQIFVDGGPSYKRTFPRARGRADVILKRTSHITIVLDGVGKKVRKSSDAKAMEDKGRKRPPLARLRGVKKKKTLEPRKDEKKEIVKTKEQEKMKERMKEGLKTEKIKAKRERGIRRFFRRKAI